ncbi:WXG100 family type VII secretion target [Streptomyces guryensis]|uniref:WXG100 family type VII secretion target n=1 Tax=Streptomyces guryensis TaxID=2886947 RepID=A0A9Q3VQ48_9ACTN|nr:WXG100 family type VII secretion target [Streptomyces guryensis]MCD9875378.1 WXG100 family type VII secretion target [Streptomyces guryensis]
MAEKVLVGASAPNSAREFTLAVSRFEGAATSVESLADRLASSSSWQGQTAQLFAREREQFTQRMTAMRQALSRIAQAAQAIVQAIEETDRQGAEQLPNAPSSVSPALAMAANAPLLPQGPLPPEPPPLATDPRFPPVVGWAGPDLPVVNAKGAFQPDHGNDYGADQPDSTTPLLQDYAESIAGGSYLYPGADAARFFQHYLDGSGSDLHFSSLDPYTQSQKFQHMVDQTVRDQVALARATGKNGFDSGYIYNSDMFPDNGNWTGAIKGCFVRVAGHQTPQGTWETTLQISSYYQFVPGANFGPLDAANGAALHELERMGVARNYHSLGTATLEFDDNGSWILPDPGTTM